MIPMVIIPFSASAIVELLDGHQMISGIVLNILSAGLSVIGFVYVIIVIVVFARVYVDNTLALQKIGQTAGSDPAEAIFTGSAILPLTAGGHHIVLASHSTLAYPGSFISYFDNIKIEPIGVQPPSLLSSTAVGV
jgi:hypothetical protein